MSALVADREDVRPAQADGRECVLCGRPLGELAATVTLPESGVEVRVCLGGCPD